MNPFDFEENLSVDDQRISVTVTLKGFGAWEFRRYCEQTQRKPQDVVMEALERWCKTKGVLLK